MKKVVSQLKLCCTNEMSANLGTSNNSESDRDIQWRRSLKKYRQLYSILTGNTKSGNLSCAFIKKKDYVGI